MDRIQANDEYDLERFIRAQQPIYAATILDLRRGKIHPHHMDFIFPRLASRCGEPGAAPFAITSLDEASEEFLFETIFFAWFDSLLDEDTIAALRPLDLPAAG